jgi:hypothetical protein
MSYYNEEGCCLTCTDKEHECLCFECVCSQCSAYNVGRKCDKTLEFQEQMTKNIQLTYEDDFLELKFTGPINSSNYQTVKPYIQAHFRYNFEFKYYEVCTYNVQFIQSLIRRLKEAGFNPVLKGRLAENNSSLSSKNNPEGDITEEDEGVVPEQASGISELG